MEKRNIRKVAVLGSGVMGSRIACHFAGIGLQVLLLDIVPKEAVESKKASERNKIVNDALTAAVKSNPSPVYHKNVIKKITTGNFDDDMKKISDCDWVIEVVVERLDIKKQSWVHTLRMLRRWVQTIGRSVQTIRAIGPVRWKRVLLTMPCSWRVQSEAKVPLAKARASIKQNILAKPWPIV